jgi:acyl-CoA reductase-like NAD-dependent aldehyde dehydrogenase
MTENAPGAKLGEIGIASPLTAGRHLVHERVAEAYAEVLVRKAKALVVGDPFDKKVQVGPIIDERQAANVERIVADLFSEWQWITMRSQIPAYPC